MRGEDFRYCRAYRHQPCIDPVLLPIEGRVAGRGTIALETARRLLGRLKIGKLLIGNRAEPSGDLEGAAQAIVRMGDLASHLGQFVESIDLNPLILLGSGCVAVDALVVGRAARSPATPAVG